jgi:DNA-binding NarL/FixJ family response regulator
MKTAVSSPQKRQQPPELPEVKRTVFVVDDHALFRGLLVEALNQTGDFLVVGSAADGTEAVAALTQSTPDLVVLDLIMPTAGGLEVMMAIKSSRLRTKVVVCTGVEASEANEALLALGVAAIISKTSSIPEFLATMRSAVRGEPCLTPRTAESLRELVRSRGLKRQMTSVDLTTLRMLASDHSPKEIAQAVGISVSGVYKIRKRISVRTGATRLRDFRSLAARLGLAARPDEVGFRETEATAANRHTGEVSG